MSANPTDKFKATGPVMKSSVKYCTQTPGGIQTGLNVVFAPFSICVTTGAAKISSPNLSYRNERN